MNKLPLLIILVLLGTSEVSANPNITAWENNITNDNSVTVTMNETDTILFNITANESVNYTWYKNGTVVGSNQDNWTWATDSQTDGIWNITVKANNSDGSDSQEWTLTVTEEIQVLIDALPSSGGTINLASKTYYSNGTISINKDNVTISGNGWLSTIVVLQGSSTIDKFQGLFEAVGRRNLTLSNFNVTSNLASISDNSPNGIYFVQNVNDSIIENLAISKFKRGIRLGNSTGAIPGSYNVTIRNNDISAVRGNILLRTNGTNFYNNTIYAHDSGYERAIDINSVNKWATVENNTITGYAGIHCYSSSSNTTIRNNIIIDSNYGIEVNGCPDGNIYNNTINSSKRSGILITNSYNNNNLDIYNNLIYNNGDSSTNYNGIFFRATGAYSGAETITIRNNIIWGHPDDGIRVETSNANMVILIRNNIIGNATVGINNSVSATVNSTYNLIWNVTSNYSGTINNKTGDIFTDPLFADQTNNDFHLNSTAGRWDGSAWVTDSVSSPAIDAGDPSSDYSNEPSPNGNRINIGAYGNTIYASKSGETIGLFFYGIITTVFSDGSYLQNQSVASKTKANMTIVPSSENITVELYNWTTAYKKWNESADNTSVTVTHTICDNSENSKMRLKILNTPSGKIYRYKNTNGTGCFTYTYTLGYANGTVTYILTQRGGPNLAVAATGGTGVGLLLLYLYRLRRRRR